MKKVIPALIILFNTSLAMGQTKSDPSASFGPELGLPTGQVSEIYSLVAGGSFKVEMPIAKSPFNFIMSSGYNSFVRKGAYTALSLHDAAYLPVEVGGRLYFTRIAYIEGDVGGSFNINAGYTGPKFALVYSPVIGFSVPSKKRDSSVDFGIRYEGRVEPGGTIGQLALRVAYRVDIKKGEK